MELEKGMQDFALDEWEFLYKFIEMLKEIEVEVGAKEGKPKGEEA